jgi:hypothetical protein
MTNKKLKNTGLIEPEIIAIKRKSNSGQLSGRQFRSQYGVFSVRANDTYFRSRLGAWMEYVLEDWLDKDKG